VNDESNNQPVFSCTSPEMDGGYVQGMSLRDWFAGMAMQGLVSALVVKAKEGAVCDPEGTAQLAYIHADEMLKKRGE
jgi:hypothetical protein